MADRTTRRATPHEGSPSGSLTAALRQARCEVLPVTAADDIERHVPLQLPVTVTASPRHGIEPTVALAEQLAGRGFRVVPHLAARSIEGEAHLADVLRRLDSAGVDDAFVIAGDNVRPAGPFADAHALLTAMDRLWRTGVGRPLDRIGVAGYPEGHPMATPEELLDALRAKQSRATYVVSQLCFDAGTILSWVRELRRDGVTLPVYVGIAGAVDRRRLLAVAGRIGVGPSARYLRRHRHQMTRLLLPGGYRPDRLLRPLAPAFADPKLAVIGLHIYTFGSLATTERWRRRTLGRLGDRPT
jgi:methylenetetrahydrofolate reductase (NADPH)